METAAWKMAQLVCCMVIGGVVCGVVGLCWFGSLNVNALVYIMFVVVVVLLMPLWGGDLLYCGHKERERDNQMPALSD